MHLIEDANLAPAHLRVGNLEVARGVVDGRVEIGQRLGAQLGRKFAVGQLLPLAEVRRASREHVHDYQVSLKGFA
jgi:hypothetical protein